MGRGLAGFFNPTCAIQHGGIEPCALLPLVAHRPARAADRADMWDYIATDNPAAAVRMDELFSDVVARLAAHPKMGRTGKISG